MKKLKIMTIAGTRPEIIRLSELIKKLDKHVNHVFVYTGQNYDFELYDVFFKDLALRNPDYVLKVKSDSIGRQIANIIKQTEEVMDKEKPDAIAILGDTNSALSAIVAKRKGIPIFHMEAGNRCFSEKVPEEINRKIIDHISDINLVYTEHSRRNLLREGIHPSTIFLTGSPILEVLSANKDKIEKSQILKKLNLKEKEYFVVSVHREENIDFDDSFKTLISSLNSVAEKFKYPLIIATHPRTRKRIEALDIKLHELLQLHKPFGMLDYVKLQKNAFCVLSDSGTISEESAILKFPAVTVREQIERPEALDAGSIILCGLESEDIISSIEIATLNPTLKGIRIPSEYEINNFSDRVLRIIVGNTRLVKKKRKL